MKLIKKHKVKFFVLFTYVISWLFWIPKVVLGDKLPINQTIIIIFGGFGPMLSAMIMIWITEGKEKVKEWLKHLFFNKINFKWFIYVLVIPIIIGIATMVLFNLVSQEKINFSYSSTFFAYPIFIVFIALLGGGQEEPGWRGFALPNLLKHNNPLISSFLVGLMWTFWHIPLFLIPGSAQNSIPFVWYLINTMAISIIFTVIYLKIKNIVPFMIFHAGLNALGNYIPFQGGIQRLYPYVTIIDVLVAVIFMLVFARKEFLTKNK